MNPMELIEQQSSQSDELLEKIRQQFDFGPYPRIALDKSPIDFIDQQFVHSFATPYYLKHRRTFPSENLTILDVGCGSGYTSLGLALANPGAKIVGVDISSESIELAKQRLQHHGIEDAEFFVLSAFDLEQLDATFDYINCDEVLYLLDPPKVLAAMKSVLKPHGFIRSNLHSALQRSGFFRAQELFGKIGLMDGNPEDLEMEMVTSIFKSLKEGAELKKRTWKPEKAGNAEYFLMNYLFQGDKGYRIGDMFRSIEQAGLEFLSMTNWLEWNVWALFEDPDDLPMPLAFGLPDASDEECLTIHELIHPVHRLLDFWCGHEGQQMPSALPEWSAETWLSSRIHLHPVLKTDKVREYFSDRIRQMEPVVLSEFIKVPLGKLPFSIKPNEASVFLSLWDSPQSFTALVERYMKIRPYDPVTLEPLSAQFAFTVLKDLVTKMENYLFLFVEPVDEA